MRKTEIVVAVALVVASVFTAGVVEAKRGPSAITVCVNSTGVVSRVAANAKCVGESQKWSASKLAPQLCWDASSIDPKGLTRLVSLAPISGCVAPLRSVPVGKVVLLCADQQSLVLRWSVTRACKTGNANTWVRVGKSKTASQISVPTTIAQVAALVPSVSLSTTLITGGTFPKAVTVTANIAGTVFFAEGAFPISKLSDITSADANRWASGVVYAGVPTSVPIDVTAVLNGYYRVYVANSQGVLSAPASNIVTISVTRASQVTTTTSTTSTTSTTVAVRVQTLDQSAATWHTGGYYYGVDPSQSMGQCFTAGLTGPLSRISVGMTRSGSDGQITAEIFAADGSCNPTGSALATKSITDGSTLPSVSGGALTDFAFTTPVSVTATMKYAIVITTTGAYRWYRFEGDSYVGGRGIYLSNTSILYPDLMFKTYVDI